MGYSTKFKGELKFTKTPSVEQLVKIKTFLGEDCREHPEWNNQGLSYIDLELTDDFSGLKWNGAEKTYELVEKINLIISEMKKIYPEFGLEGELIAQGEECDDRWILLIHNGEAIRKEIVIKGKKVECPNCGETFILEEGE